jgi:hypothetical protein
VARYFRECPNCKQMIDLAVEECTYCGQAVDRSVLWSPVEPVRQVSPRADTDTGQSILAYRLAAVVLFLGVLLNVATIVLEIAMGGTPAGNLLCPGSDRFATRA